MASITFTGPDAQGVQRSTVVQMDDAAFALVVEAVCATEGYTGDAPGLFVINKAVANWKHTVSLYQRSKADVVAAQTVSQIMLPLEESVVVSVDGTIVDMAQIVNP